MDEKNFITTKSYEESDVIEFYEKYSKTWDERFGSGVSAQYFLECRWNSFVNIFGDANKNIALELGVGTGIYIDRCSRLFKKVTAVDGSRGMIEMLEKKLSANNISNVNVLQSDVLDLSAIATNSIDIVYFFGLIEHIIDTPRFIDEIYRVLSVDGIVIGVTPNKWSPWYKLRKFMRGTGKHCSSDRYYSVFELKKMFGKRFSLMKISYWGAVPAGLENGYLFKFLKNINQFLDKTPLSIFFGGITFKFQKQVQ